MTKFMFVILLLVIKLFSTLCASFCSTKNFINERNNLSLWRINYLFSWSWMFFAIILIWKTLSVYVHVNDKTMQMILLLLLQSRKSVIYSAFLATVHTFHSLEFLPENCQRWSNLLEKILGCIFPKIHLDLHFFRAKIILLKNK